MSNTISEGNYIGDIVKWEANPEYSREVVTIPSGTGKLKAGAVLEEGTTGYVPLTYTAGDTPVYGVPAAVLIKDIDATDAAVSAVVVSRLAIVAKNKLVYSFTDETALKKAVEGLKAIGIIAREGA